MLVVVTGEESRLEQGPQQVSARFANSVTWIPEGSRRMIIAVGAPHQWASAQTLPAAAVSTQLVSAALGEPELADMLWGPFLSYLVYSTKPNFWHRTAMFWVPGVVPVRLELQRESEKVAVTRCIPASVLGKKFRVIQ